MSRSAQDHRIVIRHAGLLGGLRNIIDIGAESDDWLALSPRCNERCGNARHAALNAESFFFENPSQVFRRLELLKTQLAETENAIYHHLSLFLHTVDLTDEVGFHGGFFFGCDLLLAKNTASIQQ